MLLPTERPFADNEAMDSTSQPMARATTTLMQQQLTDCDQDHQDLDQDQHSIRQRLVRDAPCTHASFEYPTIAHWLVALRVNEPFIAKLTRERFIVHC